MLKLDLTKTSAELQYLLLSHVAGVDVTSADVTLSAVAPIADAEAGQPNTTVTLTLVPTSTVFQQGSGEAELVRKLTRVSIDDIAVLKGFDGSLTDDAAQYTTESYVVGKLNDALGTALDAAEIVLGSQTTEDGVTSVPVTVNAFGINGTITLKVTAADTRADFNETFATEALDGFDAPENA